MHSYANLRIMQEGDIKKTAATNRDGLFNVGSQDRWFQIRNVWARSREFVAAAL